MESREEDESTEESPPRVDLPRGPGSVPVLLRDLLKTLRESAVRRQACTLYNFLSPIAESNVESIG